MKRLIVILLAFAASAPGILQAHDFSTSYSHVQAEGAEVRVAFTLNVIDLHAGPALDADGDGAVDPGELGASIDVLVAAIRENFRIGAPGPPAEVTVEGWDFLAENVVDIDFVYRFDQEVRDLTVVSTMDRLTQPNHRHLLQIGEGDQARHAVLGADTPEMEIEYAAGIPWWATVIDFIELGVEHIFTGYDHLAFLIGLLLATTTVLSLAKIVTCFTLGHSVTLALATLGVVAVPAPFIESLIALSIAYVAIENYVGRAFVHRWMVTLLFGLVHGFGFSNVLREMGLPPRRLAVSLFSFNAGVEIGQLAVVAVLFPLLIYVGRTRWREQVMAAASLAIMCLGFYWFVQRALLA